ncbi:MAG: thiamine diphosphokinase [Bulleidia sp.]|nr:thiamine diphosphokinase [Bulleidia sp.]
MSKTCILALTLSRNLPDIEGDWIGVDRGALVLARAHRHMKLALGDFDSVKPEDMQIIRDYADEVIQLNPIKDDSDSEAAVRYVAKQYDTICMIGGLGGRIDHELVNLALCMEFAGKLILMDEHNRIEAFPEGTWHIARKAHYYSFFAEDAVISLEGFAYPLDHRHMTKKDLYGLSNEINNEEGILTVHTGTVLMIASKD